LPRSNLSQYSNRFQPQVSTLKTNTSGKGVEKDTKGKSVEKESSKVRPTIKCYKCQGYRHIAANYSNLVKIALINGVLVAESESDSDKFIYRLQVSQTTKKDDWRRAATFHMFTKIGDKNYKVIVNSESCINAISSNVTKKFGLEVVSHPHLYKVP